MPVLWGRQSRRIHVGGRRRERIAAMSFFATAAEVDQYVGGVLRLAAADPFLGPRLASASLSLRLSCSDVPAHITLGLFDPVTVAVGDAAAADVELTCTSDLLDAYLRGHGNLVEALAQGDVVARGRISKALKVLPVLEQAFPFYRQIVAARHPRSTSAPGVSS